MKYITRQQAAERLSISLRALDGLISRGSIPAYRVGPKLVRLSEQDLESYMKKQRLVPERKRKPEPMDRPCLYVPGMKVV